MPINSFNNRCFKDKSGLRLGGGQPFKRSLIGADFASISLVNFLQYESSTKKEWSFFSGLRDKKVINLLGRGDLVMPYSVAKDSQLILHEVAFFLFWNNP
ncbi:hypothetical protein PAEPH01_2466 [Pancytospora epiphaga]|nr:hypothetical protein PAEPH01_2466 [Pancytospora epiphaga]